MAFTRTAAAPFAAPALTLATANAEGSAVTAIRTDADILVFDAVAGGQTEAYQFGTVGVAVVASRRDHGHGIVPQNQANGSGWFVLSRLFSH